MLSILGGASLTGGASVDLSGLIASEIGALAWGGTGVDIMVVPVPLIHALFAVPSLPRSVMFSLSLHHSHLVRSQLLFWLEFVRPSPEVRIDRRC